jgi:PAS domain S-box-containing protein
LIPADPGWRRLAESIPHIVWVASNDGDIEFMNKRASDYLGWAPGTLHEEIWKTVVHPDDSTRVYGVWQHAVSTETPFSSEYRVRRFDGEFRWFCGRGKPVHEPGQPTRWICTATDIDEQRRSAAAVAEIGARLADAQRLTRVGSWSIDVATRTHTWSDQLYRLLGYEPGEFPPDKDRFFERLHPGDASRMRAAVLGQVSRPGPWQDEFRIVLPGDVVRWLVARTQPVLDDEGQVVAIHGTAQDVTSRKQVEERLRLQADLLDAVGQAVIAVDLTGNIIYWGPGAEQLYGWEAEEALGRRITDVIPTVHGNYDAAEIMGGRDMGGRWSGTLELRRRDGSTFVAEVRRTPVLDDAGRLVALIGTSSDVTAREELNANLREAHREAEETLTLLDTLQAEAPLGFAFVDTDLRMTRVNRELASFMGAPAEDLIGRKVGEVLPAALWKELEPVYHHVLSSGEVVRDRRVIPANAGGRSREITTSHYPIRTGDEIIGVGVVINDVTDRVEAEGFRSAVMSQVVDGVYTLDCDGRLQYMNSAASKMLGWTEDELRGQYMHELVPFTRLDRSRVKVIERALLTQGPPGRLEQSAGESFTRKDGSTFPAAYSALPLRIGSTVEGVVVVFRDISKPGASPNVIRVLIADSDRNATASFQTLLDRHEGIVVVAVATTSASALEAAEQLKPDVVLVNVELPDLHGLATTVTIKANVPSTKVILMTEKYDDLMTIASIDAGCAGVLDKSRAWVDLVSAVRAAYHGETILCQEELQRVLSKVRGGSEWGRATHLTDREEEVLACLREGLSNAMVAERLGVTANTVSNHVQRILYKLNVHSKLEAVVLTSREGLTGQESNR